MKQQPEEHTLIQGVDALASRVKLYSGSIMAFGALVAVMTALAVKFVTAEVSTEVKATRAALEGTRIELHQYQATQVAKAVQDSARFERVMEVVELAVVALVEPHGSTEQRRAVANLRSKRHVSLRP